MNPPDDEGPVASGAAPRGSPAAEPGPNPIARHVTMLVSVPETIEVTMVNASTLHDYEVWAAFASALFSIATGFVTSYVQDPTKPVMGWVGAIFVLMWLVASFMALQKRRQLLGKSRQIPFSATER